MTGSTTSSFLAANWMLLLTMFVSGAMLLWPIIQRRSSGLVEIGTLRATHLLNNNDPVLLDVREPREFADVKMRNTVHIPLSQLKDRADQISKDKTRPVIIVCSRGIRGRSAAATVRGAGFGEIYLLNGGLQAWRDAGLPIEKV